MACHGQELSAYVTIVVGILSKSVCGFCSAEICHQLCIDIYELLIQHESCVILSNVFFFTVLLFLPKFMHFI